MHRKLTRPKLLRFWLTAAVLAGVAACGDPEEPPGAAETGEPPAVQTTEAPDEATTTTTGDDEGALPEAIVSLSPTATEILFAIGAGDQVLAVDSESDFPAEAPVDPTLLSFEPSVEAVAALEPDLVVLSFDPGDVVAGLEALDIEVLVQPSAQSLDDTFDQIAELGIATGHEDEAADLVNEIGDGLDALTADLPDRDEPLTYYYELDNTLYSVTSETFIGELLGRAGLVSIADAADPDGAAGGFPQLSAELIVEADPDVIFLADADFGESADTLAARPGFAGLTALTDGRVVGLDADIASRWGPRVVDLLALVIDAVVAVPVG